MPYYTSSQEWLEQSSLLLEARPETTRITTRYSIQPYKRRVPKPKQPAVEAGSAPQTTPAEGDSAAAAAKPPRARLVLKTYDPASGVALQYKTTKAAEVSRLVQMLGALGRRQAGLPPAAVRIEDKGGDEAMPDAPPAAAAETAGGAAQKDGAGGGGGAGAGAGGKGKKKKGKR